MEELKSNQELISPADMEIITQLKLRYEQNLQNIGRLRYEFKLAEVKFLTLLENTLQNQQEIVKKYGVGNIDLVSGIFTSTLEELPEVKTPKLKKSKKLKK